MMIDVVMKIEAVDASHVKVLFNDFSTEQEFSDFFKFQVPGYKFMPTYRSGMWDGYARLYDMRTKKLPAGLVPIARKFAQRADAVVDSNVDEERENVTRDGIKSYVDSLQLCSRGVPIEVREYQYDAIYHGIANKRTVLVAPTSSGKSAMIYCKIRWHLDNSDTDNILLIVPSTQLVEQMYSDFEDYSTQNGWSVNDNVQVLYSGKDRVFSKRVMISTWQSLNAMRKSKSKLFADIVDRTTIGLFDEVHTAKSDEIKKILDSFNNAYVRMGTTGTLDGTKINELILVGIFGMTYQVTTTKKLMDDGHVTPLKIKAIILQHPKELRETFIGMRYPDEINYLISSKARNTFISRLALSCKGNTLILYNFVEKHGSVLDQLIRELNPNPDRKIYFIHGGVDTEQRELIRRVVDTESNAIIIATASLFSTGTNIPSLENIIFGIPTKSTIRVRQSIGRSLRLKNGKTQANLYDIADDMSSKGYYNTTMKHMAERLKIYDAEQFEYSISRIPLPNDDPVTKSLKTNPLFD